MEKALDACRWLGLLFGLSVMSVFFVSQASAGAKDWEALRILSVGKYNAARMFTLEDLYRRKVGLRDYRGQAILLNFFESSVPSSKQRPTMARALMSRPRQPA